MVATAAVIILLVRYGLIAGIDRLAAALSWTAKARGRATGLATSAPELVCLVAAGLAGVWDVGLWNIASSNIINVSLMTVAVLRYRQVRQLMNRRFVDEIGFALLAILVPVVLMQASIDTHWVLVPVLFAFFAFYQVVDTRMNPPRPEDKPAEESVGSLPIGFIMVLTTLIGIAVVGFFLGDAAEQVVNELGVPPAAAGWLLGVVTSLPEMVTFFAVYGSARKAGTLGDLEDTQEALDNLAASNMANVGLIYPTGLAVYLLGNLMALQ